MTNSSCPDERAIMGDPKTGPKETVENDRQNCGRRNLIEVIQLKKFDR